MGETTKIEWTATVQADGTVMPGATWNPWQGCRKVSEGCRWCYMYRDKARYGNDGSIIVRSKPATFNLPLKLARGTRIFTCSWSDFFIPFADEWREDAWHIIRQTPFLFYLILTKRPEAIAGRLPADWDQGYPNVGLGVTVENADYKWRLSYLERIPAVLRFVSAEPLLGDLGDLSPWLPNLGWLIAGGESGPKARPAHPDWARSLRDQAAAARVPFFWKQCGEWADATNEKDGAGLLALHGENMVIAPNGDVLGAGDGRRGMVESDWRQRGGAWMVRVGKARAGHLLDGVEYRQFPEVKP